MCVSVRSHRPGTGSKDFAICRDSVDVAIVVSVHRHPHRVGICYMLDS